MGKDEKNQSPVHLQTERLRQSTDELIRLVNNSMACNSFDWHIYNEMRTNQGLFGFVAEGCSNSEIPPILGAMRAIAEECGAEELYFVISLAESGPRVQIDTMMRMFNMATSTYRRDSRLTQENPWRRQVPSSSIAFVVHHAVFDQRARRAFEMTLKNRRLFRRTIETKIIIKDAEQSQEVWPWAGLDVLDPPFRTDNELPDTSAWTYFGDKKIPREIRTYRRCRFY